jgi:hypothetical protein
MNDETIRDFINKHNWTFAKTYADICPHEYIVKGKLDRGDLDDFTALVKHIREQGFTAYYKSRSGKYYIVDDHYYWTMGEPVNDTTIINRAKLSDYSLIDNAWVWNGE